MEAKLRGNQCITCKKTHEECVGSNCERAWLSEYVCRMFGVRPVRKVRRK